MYKRIIIFIAIMFVVMSATTFWIFNSFDQANAEAKGRTEQDFVTEKYVVKDLWEMQKKKGTMLISSYLFIKVEDSPINLRLPWDGSLKDDDVMAESLKVGNTIQVKLLKEQLAAAQQNGPILAIKRFFMGDRREVTVFKLIVDNKVLVDKDINTYDEGKVTLLGRLADQPMLIFIFAIPLFIIARFIRKRNMSRINAQ